MNKNTDFHLEIKKRYTFEGYFRVSNKCFASRMKILQGREEGR